MSDDGRPHEGGRPVGLAEMAPAQALWRGAVTALVVVLPVAVFNNLLIADGEDASSPLILVLFALIMLGGASGGWAVIRLSPEAGLPYAAGASALAYVVAQGLGVVLRLVRGDELNWAGYPFAALLMATCGMLGGMFARRWQGSGGGTGGGT